MAGYQVMPRLTPDEYAELEASIVSVGVQVPITVGPDGTIIDGHHRDEIARRHDLHCPRVTARGDEATLRGLAFSLNLHRRHLSREQRRDLIAASLRSDPQLSNREHARRTGASDKTVQSVRVASEANAEIPHYEPGDRTESTGRAARGSTGQPPRPAPEPAPLPPGFNPGDLDALNAKGVTADQLSKLGRHTPVPPGDRVRPDRRRPLMDDARDVQRDLERCLARLDKLMADDRLPGHVHDVRNCLAGTLMNFRDSAACHIEAITDRTIG